MPHICPLPPPSTPMLILASLSVCRNNATAGSRAPGDHPTPTDSRPLLHLSRPTVISKDTFDCKFPFPTACLFRIQVANFREKNASHHISCGVFLSLWSERDFYHIFKKRGWPYSISYSSGNGFVTNYYPLQMTAIESVESLILYKIESPIINPCQFEI